MRHEREDFVGEKFLIRKMIKKFSGGNISCFFLSYRSRKEFFGGDFFMYEENEEHDFVRIISHI